MSDVVNVVLSIMIVAVGAAIAYGITVVANYFNAKKEDILACIDEMSEQSKNMRIDDAMKRVVEIVSNIVNALNDTYKKELIAASSDGKLTEEDKILLRNKALELIDAEVSEPLKDLISTVIGDFGEWVRTLLENAVTAAKKKVTSTSSKSTATKSTSTNSTKKTSLDKSSK